MKFLIALLFGLVLLVACANANPIVSGYVPANNSYYGRGMINFSINISDEEFNTSSGRLYIISEDAYLHDGYWDSYTLQCTSYGVFSWVCSVPVSFAIAGSDTLEFFYFTVKENGKDDVFNLGNSTHPLRFKIDRTPPVISFIKPVEKGFVSGSFIVEISATDSVSGVNESTLKMSLDNSTWINTTNQKGTFNFSGYVNGQNITIYVQAADNIGNYGSANINATVDNEVPRLYIISPSDMDILSGNATFVINVSDAFSGFESDDITYIVADHEYLMSCSGNLCTSKFDTSKLNDGIHVIKFIVADYAGNINTSTVSAEIINKMPALKLNAKDYMSGTVSVSAEIADPSQVIKNVSLKIEKGGVIALVQMSCNSIKTLCNYSIDTKNYDDGIYKLTANAENPTNSTITDAITRVIDNTKPEIIIDDPGTVKGVFAVNAVVKDSNPDVSKVTFKVNDETKYVTCISVSVGAKCSGQYDSAKLSDGENTVQVSATDKAGHKETSSKAFVVDNLPPNLVFIKIEPIKSTKPTNVSFTANANDVGSSVKSINLKIDNIEFSTTLKLENVSGVWFGRFFFRNIGTYKVNIEMADENGNNFTYIDGHFYIGPLSCGDSVCQPEENYCFCPSDCNVPECSEDHVVSCISGLPSCVIPTKCGDEICSDSETCSSCSRDCGICSELESVGNRTIIIEKIVPSKTTTRTVYEYITKYAEANPFIFILYIIVIAAVLILAFIVFWKRREKRERGAPTFFEH